MERRVGTPEGKRVQDGDVQEAEWKPVVVWQVAFFLAALHFVALAAVLTVPLWPAFYTYLWGLFLVGVSAFGVTAGVHRLWTHRSYKANVPLRVLLAICYSVAGQYTIYEWVRDHRTHHKFSETDADPHNAKRGFFFSHIGWQMTKRNPEVIRKGKTIDMSDILSDPVVKLHTKYFRPLKFLLCFILPTVIPCYLWGETWYNSYMITILRYVLSLNNTFSVNSIAHLYGSKPYDKHIYAAENIAVAFTSMGEGWHNYHHVFPWDYRAAELGSYFLNMTTFYLDLFAKIGWAYDLKCPSQDLVKRVAERYGDGTHPQWGEHMKEVKEEDDPHKKILYPSTDKGIGHGELFLQNASDKMTRVTG